MLWSWRTTTFNQSTSLLAYPHCSRYYSPYYRSNSAPQGPVQIASVETNVVVLLDQSTVFDIFGCLYMSHTFEKTIARVVSTPR